MNKSELMKTANEIRKGAITGVYSAKSGHPGGSLSAADIYSYLFFEELNIDPKNPKKPDLAVTKQCIYTVIIAGEFGRDCHTNGSGNTLSKRTG